MALAFRYADVPQEGIVPLRRDNACAIPNPCEGRAHDQEGGDGLEHIEGIKLHRDRPLVHPVSVAALCHPLRTERGVVRLAPLPLRVVVVVASHVVAALKRLPQVLALGDQTIDHLLMSELTVVKLQVCVGLIGADDLQENVSAIAREHLHLVRKQAIDGV